MTGAPSEERFRLREGPAATAAVRATVDRVAAAHGLGADECFALQLATTEALGNALRHGEGDRIEVAVETGVDAIEIEVRDGGSFRADGRLDAEGGRGIPLIVSLVDEVEFARTPEGTRVRMRKRLQRAA